MKEPLETVEFIDDLAFNPDCVPNINKVPKKMWSQWDNTSRYIFNQTFHSASDQRVIKHPLTNTIPEDEWKTIRWNIAWLAADAANGKRK